MASSAQSESDIIKQKAVPEQSRSNGSKQGKLSAGQSEANVLENWKSGALLVAGY